jgi:hypothetical protein
LTFLFIEESSDLDGPTMGAYQKPARVPCARAMLQDRMSPDPCESPSFAGKIATFLDPDGIIHDRDDFAFITTAGYHVKSRSDGNQLQAGEWQH